MEIADQEMVPILTENGNNDQNNDLAIDIVEYLGFEPAPECCIYKIPERSREAMEKAYTPQLISIGPLHHGKKSLAKMERQKSRYYQKFRERTADEITLEKFRRYIKENAGRICRCYDELAFETEFQASEFKRMILYDAVFIIEFFLRHSEREARDFLLKREWFRLDLHRDLILLENQLPFFVLKDLYNLAFGSSDKPSFLSIACLYLEIKEDPPDQMETKHLTDLFRCALVKTHPPNSNEKINKIYSATMLNDAGVRFKAVDTKLMLDLRFEKGELRIPTFYVGLRTDALIRNVMALEQCHYPEEAYFCSYIQLLDSLIDTDRDVDLLVKEGILDNGMGSSAAVADMINTLMVEFARAQLPTCYAQIGNNLNKYYDNFWNRTVATLRHVYFNNLWRGTGTVAAFIVVLLTLTQTVLAILDRVKPTK
ncbi:hypothetical protein PTKIN_Ptkin12aG0205900 [Pterospermum kingtungense]